MSIERFATSVEGKTTVIGNSRSITITRDDNWLQIANVLAANRVFAFLDLLSCVSSQRALFRAVSPNTFEARVVFSRGRGRR
jgi:hypothetical protein